MILIETLSLLKSLHNLHIFVQYLLETIYKMYVYILL
jgi:hypothetical protein